MTEKKDVKIQIDKNHIEVTPPVTGTRLHELGHVAEGYDLWKEIHGQGDDMLIAKDHTAVQIQNGDKFYTAQSSLNPGEYAGE